MIGDSSASSCGAMGSQSLAAADTGNKTAARAQRANREIEEYTGNLLCPARRIELMQGRHGKYTLDLFWMCVAAALLFAQLRRELTGIL